MNKVKNESKPWLVRTLCRAWVIAVMAIPLNFNPCTQTEAAEPDVILTICAVKCAVQPVEEKNVRSESWDEQIRTGRRYQQQSLYSEAEKSFLEAFKKAKQFGQADPRLAISLSPVR